MKKDRKLLTPYLDYKVLVKTRYGTGELICLNTSGAALVCIEGAGNIGVEKDEYILPLLRPLSELKKEIGHEIDLAPSGALHNESPYYVFQYCFKHHFDAFGLIPSGLALPKK